MRQLLTAALAAALGTASAADLRIYPSFAEVREPVRAAGTTLTVTLPEAAWAGLIPGTLDLDGLPFTSAVQRQEPNWLASLEGKTVFLRREGEAEARPVTLIRARDLLVRDAQGRYLTARYEDLSFDVAPPVNPLSPIQTLTFTLPQAGAGTLAYLTRGVTWAPRYTLRAGNQGAQLSALADIRNGTDLAYDVKATELYAGDVEVRGQPVPAPAPAFRNEVATDAAVTSAPTINPQGELRGLYRYALSAPFTLPANSVVTLPFLTPKLTRFERYAGLNTYFTPQNTSGTLSRFYRLGAEERLPGGLITVREEGRLVGQTSIPETAPGGQIEFSLGNDPDVRYTRAVQTVSSERNAQGNPVKTTYRVTYTFESSKDRAVRAEVTEIVGGRRIVIDSAPARQNQARAELRVDVPAGGKVTRSFTVVVDNS